MTKQVVIYQSKNGGIEVKFDEENNTVFLTQQQVSRLFDVQKAAISKHIKNIFNSGELDKSSTVSKMETVRFEGSRKIKRDVEYYNLDLILSIGYRVNSMKATKFRQWATKTLRQHILNGYTINKKRLLKNYQSFIQAVDNVKKLLPISTEIKTESVLELVKIFASTWFSLNLYDKKSFPKKGNIKKHVIFTSEELESALADLKQELMKKGEASELFGQEKQKESIKGIIGNVFQSFDGKDVYPTLEEKAAHLLYFFVKNHPFTDGNKRSGAFAFVWFLQKVKILDVSKLPPSALTTLTLLVAESDPKDKDKIIGLILMLLN